MQVCGHFRWVSPPSLLWRLVVSSCCCSCKKRRLYCLGAASKCSAGRQNKVHYCLIHRK
jgi:hypothetical protein